ARFRFGGGGQQPDAPADEAIEGHLGELYRALIAPLRDSLTGDRLVIVPHGFLHHVPFHALMDGRRALADAFSVSYAPSASVFALCARRRARAAARSLVLGVPDRAAPHIADEVREVAARLPGAQAFVGGEATHARLRAAAPRSRFVHIATH